MQMLIAGEWCDASDGGTIDIVNPGTGALIDRDNVQQFYNPESVF